MKNILFLILFLPVISWSQSSSKSFVIEGKLDGFPDGTSVKLYKNGDNAELASSVIEKEKFVLKGNVAEPVLCFLAIGGERPYELFVENSAISVKGSKGAADKYEVKGSVSHNEFSGFLQSFLPLLQQSSSLVQTINSRPAGEERESLMETYNSIQERIQGQIDNQVKAKPKSVVTAFILDATYQFSEDVMVLEKRFNSLDKTVQESESGTKLYESIRQNKIGAVGSEALDFTQEDTTGNPISLSSFKGQYVLVDFWASWCGPCRQENPNVVANFQKFKDKNFTVLGVSLDRPGQKDRWLKAIQEDKLTWTHVSDLKFWSNAVAVMYNIKGIPQNLLIDPSGKIVAKNLRGHDLGTKLCEVLGCN